MSISKKPEVNIQKAPGQYPKNPSQYPKSLRSISKHLQVTIQKAPDQYPTEPQINIQKAPRSISKKTPDQYPKSLGSISLQSTLQLWCRNTKHINHCKKESQADSVHLWFPKTLSTHCHGPGSPPCGKPSLAYHRWLCSTPINRSSCDAGLNLFDVSNHHCWNVLWTIF